MFAAVARIVRAVSVPVSADIEDGYGLDPRELVERLLETGAVGCNLEDSDHGTLKDPRQHADWLSEVREESGDALFINARVDTFLFGNGDPADAVERARLYVAAGADCVYPLLAPPEVFPALREGIDGPMNMAARRPRNPWPNSHVSESRASPSALSYSGNRRGHLGRLPRRFASDRIPGTVFHRGTEFSVPGARQ